MQLEQLKEGVYVFDIDCPQFGQGLIITYEDQMIDVHYPEIEETVNYSERDAVKYLNIIS